MFSVVQLLVFVVFLSIGVSAESETAFYVPRSFYVIDAKGHQSPVSVISADHIAHRLKRSPSGGFVTSSSSSSSSTNSNGGPVYFQQSSQQSNGPINGFAPQPPLFQNLGPMNLFPSGNNLFATNNFVAQNNQFPLANSFQTQSVGGLDDRFDDSPNQPFQSQQSSQTFNGGSGVYTSTTGVRLPNGQVQYTTHTGKL